MIQRIWLACGGLAVAICVPLASTCAEPNGAAPRGMDWIQVAKDRRSFVRGTTGKKFTPWGVNYDHDVAGRLIEDYWEREWPKVEEDFREMRELGANVVRVHLQLGKFMAAGIGRIFVGAFERGILQLPLVRNVYSSVKQVSDFLFSPRQIEYTRVVAVEYPRTGIWSLGLVTGESMIDIRAAANEPVLSVLVPTSPMPITGYTINVRKSEAIDLNITIDQAFQFIVSCGVVVPPQQLQEALEKREELEAQEASAQSC